MSPVIYTYAVNLLYTVVQLQLKSYEFLVFKCFIIIFYFFNSLLALINLFDMAVVL